MEEAPMILAVIFITFFVGFVLGTLNGMYLWSRL
jgi:hypothetical protein